MIITIQNVENMMRNEDISNEHIEIAHDIAKLFLECWFVVTVSQLKQLNRFQYYMTLAYVEQRYFELVDNKEECSAFEAFWKTVVTKGPSF